MRDEGRDERSESLGATPSLAEGERGGSASCDSRCSFARAKSRRLPTRVWKTLDPGSHLDRGSQPLGFLCDLRTRRSFSTGLVPPEPCIQGLPSAAASERVAPSGRIRLLDRSAAVSHVGTRNEATLRPLALYHNGSAVGLCGKNEGGLRPLRGRTGARLPTLALWTAASAARTAQLLSRRLIFPSLPLSLSFLTLPRSSLALAPAPAPVTRYPTRSLPPVPKPSPSLPRRSDARAQARHHRPAPHPRHLGAHRPRHDPRPRSAPWPLSHPSTYRLY